MKQPDKLPKSCQNSVNLRNLGSKIIYGIIEEIFFYSIGTVDHNVQSLLGAYGPKMK